MKTPLLKWLTRWLALHTPNCGNKFVCLDHGGKLTKCSAVAELFKNAGYALEFTGADNSYQNGQNG
jgi:hypothetical protein